ncbi:MAG: hypothetical protein IJB33_00390 [Akkermansia sp.]|nr:hypothetical protein [Akkermansia sp.]
MKTRLLFFIGGVVAATFARLASGCPKAREMAVKGLAKGMRATEKAKEQFSKIKVEAEGICKEAQEKAHHCDAKSCEMKQQPQH